MLAAEIDCTHEDNGVGKYFSLKSTAVLNQPGILEWNAQHPRQGHKDTRQNVTWSVASSSAVTLLHKCNWSPERGGISSANASFGRGKNIGAVGFVFLQCVLLIQGLGVSQQPRDCCLCNPHGWIKVVSRFKITFKHLLQCKLRSEGLFFISFNF